MAPISFPRFGTQKAKRRATFQRSLLDPNNWQSDIWFPSAWGWSPNLDTWHKCTSVQHEGIWSFMPYFVLWNPFFAIMPSCSFHWFSRLFFIPKTIQAIRGNNLGELFFFSTWNNARISNSAFPDVFICAIAIPSNPSLHLRATKRFPESLIQHTRYHNLTFQTFSELQVFQLSQGGEKESLLCYDICHSEV